MIPDHIVEAALDAQRRACGYGNPIGSFREGWPDAYAEDMAAQRAALEAAAPMLSHTKELHFGDGKVLVRQGDTPQGEKVLALAQGDVAFPINDHPTEWKTEEPKEAFDVFITFSNIESARVLQDTLNEIVCRWSRELSRPAQPLDGAAMTAPKTIPTSAVVCWGYEDEIPEDVDLTRPMYDASRIVSGVRMYPYIVVEGVRIYLGDSGISPERIAQWAPESRGHK